MRIRTLIFLLSAAFATPLCAAEAAPDSAQIFGKAYAFYVRGDYSAAKELFKQICDGDSETAREASLYLGSIAAYEGDAKAMPLLEFAMKSPNLQTRRNAALQYCKYASANGMWDLIAANAVKYANSDSADSYTDWLCAVALLQTGDKEKAGKLFGETLQLYFNDIAAIGVDVFIQARLDGDEFAKSFNVSKLGATTPTGEARLEMLAGKTPSQPQAEICLFAQIKQAQGGKKIDLEVLKNAVYKYSSAPFAYLGSLAAAKIEFDSQSFEAAIVSARDALRLAPPEISHQSDAIILLGDCLRMQKKYDDARDEYLKVAMNRAARGEPVAESLYKTGLCWYEQGEWGKAHVYFERVFVAFFRYEYWGSRAYYYDARALYSLGLTRDSNATLIEYFRRAKDKNSSIYKDARAFYDKI